MVAPGPTRAARAAAFAAALCAAAPATAQRPPTGSHEVPGLDRNPAVQSLILERQQRQEELSLKLRHATDAQAARLQGLGDSSLQLLEARQHDQQRQQQFLHDQQRRDIERLQARPELRPADLTLELQRAARERDAQREAFDRQSPGWRPALPSTSGR